MDPYFLDCRLAHRYKRLGISANNLVLLSEVSLYEKTFKPLFNSEANIHGYGIDGLEEWISSCLCCLEENTLAKDWKEITKKKIDLEIDIDNIPVSEKDFGVNAMMKSCILSRVLSEVVLCCKVNS